MKNTMKKPVVIPVEKLRPFAGHPFKVKDDDEMNTLIESIQTQGVLSPLIVRPIENTEEYEVVSGHRRLHAAQKAGITEVPALIYALDRDSAAIAVVDSNLHREHILPSEKAFAYKLKMEALSHQGKRTDLTLSQLATKLDTATEIGNCSGESRDTVYRYIRLTHLIPELLDLMDEGKIALMVGEALSYLGDKEQYAVLEQCEMNDCTPSYAQAVEMKKRYQDGNLTADNISEIFSREKANQRETIKISTEKLRKYAPNADAKQLEDFILKACEHYRKFLIRQRNRDER
ncbi:ParB/RepB/Spo0J family partition protein [Hominenteromicrobium sp.]|uniref:ParB/RepB/Spo0J family partition protein n=1 Tax=Hominenteromicrobium sp. TaxID=3073581 RepID=UPI003A8FF9CE